MAVNTERNWRSNANHKVPTGIYNAEDSRVEWYDQEKELDHHGESLMYVSTCEIAEDIFGRGDDDNRLHYKHVSLSSTIR